MPPAPATATTPAPGPVIPADQLAAATPSQVDEVLASIWTRFYTVDDQVAAQRKFRDDFRQRLAAVAAGTYRYSYSDRDKARDVTGLERVEEKIAELTALGEQVLAETVPYEDEFDRRGGWTRAYLVTNHGGHIHRTRACDTCFPTTRFVWITTLSGHDESEIVELAGAGACTRCYPTAPVETRSRPCRILDPAQEAARAAKAEAKRIRDEAAAAKAIANPDGSILRTSGAGAIRSERTAEIEYVDLAVRHRWISTDGTYGQHMLPTYEADMDTLLAALAHKRGTSIPEQRELLAGKVDKKYAREVRQAQ